MKFRENSVKNVTCHYLLLIVHTEFIINLNFMAALDIFTIFAIINHGDFGGQNQSPLQARR